MKAVKLDMIKYCRNFPVIVIMLLSFVLMGAATIEKGDAVKFDFKKMSKYFHAVLDERHHFPESVVLMNDYVYSLTALGEAIDPQRKERIISFAKEVQQPDGGFAVDMQTKSSSSLYTEYTLESLALINSVSSIDVGRAKSYFSSLKQSDGGFSFSSKKMESTLITTYHTVHSLVLLNALDIVDKAKTAEYIKTFEKKGTGGFGFKKETGFSTSKGTYMAVYALKTLGMLDEDTKKRSVQFLTSTQYTGNFKKTKELLTLEEQVYTLAALRVLESTNVVNKETVAKFLKTFYVPEEGAFGALPGFKSAPDPTTLGIRGLVELGMLKRPDEIPVK